MNTPNKMGLDYRPTSKSLGSLESRLMDLLWDTQGDLSVQDVCRMLGPGNHYKTVMTVLNRLVEKNLLRRILNGRAYLYSPAIDRQDYAQAVAVDLVQNYSTSYGDGALSHIQTALLEALPADESGQPSSSPRHRDTRPQQEWSLPTLSQLAAAIGGVEILIWLLGRANR